MGVVGLSGAKHSSDTCEDYIKLPNKYKFKILEIFEIEEWTIALVQYDTTNFEGKKIMLFEGRVKDRLLKADNLDPHFIENSEFVLLARFRPDKKGKKLLEKLLGKEI
jgi:hypothetical protein